MLDVVSLTFIVTVILLFVDGLIFGVAAAKGIVSIVLIVVGLILASYIGLSIPFVGASNFMSSMESAVMSAVNRYGPTFFAMPLLWIVGFLVGLFVV